MSDGHPERVLEQQEAVRRSGVINMFDKSGVERVAAEMGFEELEAWVADASADEYIDMATEAADR